MNETVPESNSSPAINPIAVIAVLLVAAWIIGLAVIVYLAIWFNEQLVLAGGRSFSRTPWVIAHAALAAAVLFPSLVGVAAVKTPRLRAIFRTWSVAGIFMLIVLPVQLAGASEAQTAALLQIICTLVFLAVLWLIGRRGGAPVQVASGAAWPTLLAAALIGIPWVVWGALGSWLDTVLNLAAALLLGLSTAHTLSRYLFPHLKGIEGEPRLSFFLGGLAAGVAISTMGASFGHNGQQIILLFLLSGLGWLATAIGCWGAPENPAINRRSVSLLVGLVAAAPLLFVDPEELALILNLGSRDVAYYAFLATLIGLGTSLVLGLVAWALHHRGGGRRPILSAIAASAVLMGLAIAYWLIGQPGLYGEQLYVIMVDQADLSAAAGIDDPVERRTYVYQTLVQHADATQDGIRRALDTTGVAYKPYYLVNALEVDAGPLLRLWLESRPEVDRVLVSPELRPLPRPPSATQGSADPPDEPQWNLKNVGAPQVWDVFNVRGAGIVIGQSDSGVDGAHPELRDQYRGHQAGGPTGDDYNWLDPWYTTPSPTDRGGHGTHTLGSILGRTVGVAPEATWIGCVNLARNLGNAPRYLDCLQFHLAPYPQTGNPFEDGRPELGANVLNNSWGCPKIEGCDPTSLLPAVRALRAAGVFVVASAGNDGAECSTINAPISLYDEVFSIGAVDESGAVAMFSSRGPVTADGSGRTKPDVVAPGVDILSAYPNGTYEYNSGTSMAGPHVAGVVALLWSADPSLLGDIDRTEQILYETAHPLSAEQTGAFFCADDGVPPDNVAGYGLVDAFAAVERALSTGE